MDADEILESALRAVKADRALSAIDAIVRVSSGASDAERKRAVDAFNVSLLKPETGLGKYFQQSLLEKAVSHLRLSKKNFEVKMVENKNEQSTDTIVSKGKKYTVGETFSTVAALSLQPTDSGRKPACHYQFSRKVGRQGIVDVPANTQVKYVGVRAVYEGQASTKRMIFLIPKGSLLKRDGNDFNVDVDVEAAGVVNHIDPDHEYNKQSKTDV